MFIEGDEAPHCWAIPENQTVKYYVKEYGFVQGEAAIMNEILTNGPVVCGVTAPDSFSYGYHGGVYTDTTNSSDIDHDVAVAGWGVENGEKYWLIRNSWGSYWGENGWFRLIRGINNMHIEEQCASAVVDVHELDWLLDGKLRGSMYGVIPADATPQYYPKKWLRGWPHKWAEKFGGEDGALAIEKQNVAELDDIAAREDLPHKTHVPHSIAKAQHKINERRHHADDADDMMKAAMVPGSGQVLMQMPPVMHTPSMAAPALLAIGVLIGIIISVAGVVVYNKYDSRTRTRYVSIDALE